MKQYPPHMTSPRDRERYDVVQELLMKSVADGDRVVVGVTPWGRLKTEKRVDWIDGTIDPEGYGPPG